MELSILYLKGMLVTIDKNDLFLSLKIVFILPNRSDPDEMPPYMAFHMGLHYLPNYPNGIQNEKGNFK